MGFRLEVQWINSQDPAVPQSNSSCLEIDHFEETATGNIKFGQQFHQNYFRKNSKESSGIIRIEMHSLLFILSMFEKK